MIDTEILHAHFDERLHQFVLHVLWSEGLFRQFDNRRQVAATPVWRQRHGRAARSITSRVCPRPTRGSAKLMARVRRRLAEYRQTIEHEPSPEPETED